jgi:hypothetical protein
MNGIAIPFQAQICVLSVPLGLLGYQGKSQILVYARKMCFISAMVLGGF